MADFDDVTPGGLGNGGKDSWPKISHAEAMLKPIERLKPNSELHGKVLRYLIERLEMSEREMSKFYSRWRVQERKYQAYIDLENWEKQLKEMNDLGKPPKAVQIVVPYAFATISTIVTYLMHTFCGRKPMFQIGSYKKETVRNAQMMELVLQYNADHTRLIKHLYQFLQDAEVYGVGVIRTAWKKKKAKRTIWRKQKKFGFLNIFLGEENVKVREERTIYSGNEVAAQDPYMFFPDPRVPMQEVNKRGEFVFWRTFEGVHTLKAEQAEGRLKFVDAIKNITPQNEGSIESVRNLLSSGESHPGLRLSNQYNKGSANFRQIDQGTVVIIPAELGLGTSEKPEKWLFTIGNKSQIIQAEPLDLDHDMHPVAITEPYGLGYGFGQPGISDFLGPVQDTLSWFVDSHIANVRTVLNNMIIVDPSMVEMQDLKNPEPGKILRLKSAAMGKDVRSVLQQLQVHDVTAGHIRDFDMFMRMGDSMAMVNDNLRGLQDSGGRKTATEVRTSGEAAASRLASHARLISAQGLVDLTEQMVINIQQNMEDEFYLSLVGMEGIMKPIHGLDQGADGVNISPEMLTGDFYYPIHDGTLPLDRVAMLDVWKEIFMAIAGDEQLRSQFSVTDIFEYLAELGGAKNLDRFKVQMNVMPENGQPPPGAVPLPQAGQTPGLPPNPGARMAGAL